MKLDMPKAVFCGLALIAAGIYLGAGQIPVAPRAASTYVKFPKIQKVVICDYQVDYNPWTKKVTRRCARVPTEANNPLVVEVKP